MILHDYWQGFFTNSLLLRRWSALFGNEIDFNFHDKDKETLFEVFILLVVIKLSMFCSIPYWLHFLVSCPLKKLHIWSWGVKSRDKCLQAIGQLPGCSRKQYFLPLHCRWDRNISLVCPGTCSVIKPCCNLK